MSSPNLLQFQNIKKWIYIGQCVKYCYLIDLWQWWRTRHKYQCRHKTPIRAKWSRIILSAYWYLLLYISLNLWWIMKRRVLLIRLVSFLVLIPSWKSSNTSIFLTIRSNISSGKYFPYIGIEIQSTASHYGKIKIVQNS